MGARSSPEMGQEPTVVQGTGWRTPGAARLWHSPWILISILLLGCAEEQPARLVPGGNAQSGKKLIEFYACGSCHVIPGIRGATGTVGPPLTAFGRRSFIAGAVANDPENLIAWIVDPHSIEPGTAMPAVGATAVEARDIAAFLYTLQ